MYKQKRSWSDWRIRSLGYCQFYFYAVTLSKLRKTRKHIDIYRNSFDIVCVHVRARVCGRAVVSEHDIFFEEAFPNALLETLDDISKLRYSQPYAPVCFFFSSSFFFFFFDRSIYLAVYLSFCFFSIYSSCYLIRLIISASVCWCHAYLADTYFFESDVDSMRISLAYVAIRVMLNLTAHAHTQTKNLVRLMCVCVYGGLFHLFIFASSTVC